MIQQRPGDLLEIELDGKFFYIVVLTKIVRFGGNIVFAFHTDGSRISASRLGPQSNGFNGCTDIVLAKREGTAARLSRLDDLSEFWRTEYVKATHTVRRGEKATLWFVRKIDQEPGQDKRYKKLPEKFHSAMDSPTYSFDLVTKKILARYLPELNEHL